jgi:hypothetical protein
MTMKPRSRYHIDIQHAPAPASGYPAQFKLLKDDGYVKYGPPKIYRKIFSSGSQVSRLLSNR